MKKALITWIKWQDGAYLAKLLLDKWYTVYGADLNASPGSYGLDTLGISDDISYVTMNLQDANTINEVISSICPDEVYNFAAQSSISVSFDKPLMTTDVDAMWVVRLLEAIRLYCPECKFFQASSSEIFGLAPESPQTEHTSPHPRNPYGVAKLYGHWIVKNFRESYDLHASSGVLYNHESPLRPPHFVTSKIIKAAVAIADGAQQELVLGNIDAARDRWYAAEYVQAMRQMLQQDTADDYILATWVLTTVRDFVSQSFAEVSIDLTWSWSWLDEIATDAQGITRVRISQEYRRPLDQQEHPLVWDASKAKDVLWREAQTWVQALIAMMIQAQQ